MDRQILNITANEQILTVDEPIRISTNKVNYIEAHFDLGQNWTGYDSIRAVWFNDFYCISTVLDSNGVCFVPSEVMKRNGKVKVNLVGSISENDVLTDRLTSYPIVAVIVDCTAQINGAETAPITPSQFEQYVAIVRSLVDSVKDIDHIELNSDYTLTIYYSDGTSDTTGSVRGADGNGIESVTKTSTSGLVDTYTITFTDGQTTTFNVTNGAKGDTGNGISTIEKTSTVGLVDTYTITYTDGTTSTFTVTNGEKGDKGDQGEVSLSELEQATVVQTLSDTEPYHFRQTNAGQGCGHKEYDEIVGASVGWNQLSKPHPTETTTSGVTLTPNEDGSVTLNGTTTQSGTLGGYQSVPTIANHKYFMFMTGSAVSQGASIYTSIGGSTNGVSLIRSALAGENAATNLRAGANVTFTNAKAYINTIDLTLALGSTIADYIYTLEQGTAGAGVAYFRKLFPKPYYAYDAGSLKSVSGLKSHDMVGFNQWDEEWEVGALASGGGVDPTLTARRTTSFINILPNASYYVPTPCLYGRYAYYDANKNLITYNGNGFNTYINTTPSGAYYMRVTLASSYGTTYKNDICINLSDASKNGTYEQYQKHSFPLDSTITLRGLLKLQDGKLYADGDVYKNDGTVTTSWVYRTITENDDDIDKLATGSGTHYFIINVSTSNIAVDHEIICNRLLQANISVSNSNIGVDWIWSSASIKSRILIRPTGYEELRTVDDFKTWLHSNPLEVVYKVTTPTTSSADPYTNPQTCDPNGTEEYVSTSIVPIGHNTDYPMTLIDTMPTANGNYTMKLNVASGKKSITWQSV